jgi:hypothetical protein
MNEDIVRIQVTIEQMNRMARALEALSNELLVKDPKLFALMAEAPLEHIRRMRDELDQYLAELKHVPATSAS